MKRIMLTLVACAAMLVTACGAATAPAANPSDTQPPPTVQTALGTFATTAGAIADALGAAPPATLSTTHIDEQKINQAFWAFDGALDVAHALVQLHVIVPGSPRARALAGYIERTRLALNAASAAQRAANATDYRTALSNAAAAFALARQALNSGG